MTPEGEGWVSSLPLTEEETAAADEIVEDVVVGDVTIEEVAVWRQRGVRIGHA